MKKGSISTLLVVALVALGMMAFMSFEASNTGQFSAPKPPKMTPKPGPMGPGPAGPGAAIRPPVVVDRDVTVVQDDYPDTASDTTGSDVAQIQLQCYMWSYDHPNVVAPVQIQGLCARFGVTV